MAKKKPERAMTASEKKEYAGHKFTQPAIQYRRYVSRLLGHRFVPALGGMDVAEMAKIEVFCNSNARRHLDVKAVVSVSADGLYSLIENARAIHGISAAAEQERWGQALNDYEPDVQPSELVLWAMTL